MNAFIGSFEAGTASDTDDHFGFGGNGVVKPADSLFHGPKAQTLATTCPV
jgi:hypothetical protein